jgi:hypothetical protein
MRAGQGIRRWYVVALAAACVAVLAPAAAHARALVGIGDQKAAMFSDPRLAWLHIQRARLVVSWNVVRTPRERVLVDAWLADARRAGIEPLVAFGHAWDARHRKILPSVRAYRQAIAAFRARYLWVRVYTPWNEANHCSQPTCRRPERAAAYYVALRRACPRCEVVAADVLDQPNMVRWLRAFRRALPRGMAPTLWGLHNYLDANRLRSTGTRRLLRAVPGRVWFTETGGVMSRRHYRDKIAFEESPAHAAKATAWILRLAARLPRVRRVYFYQWNATSATQVWDSGFIGPYGEPRAAFAVLARARGRNPARAPGHPSTPAPPPLNEEPPPTSSSPPPPPTDPAPAPGPAPPSPPCLLGILCPPPVG